MAKCFIVILKCSVAILSGECFSSPLFYCSFPHPLPDIVSWEWILFWFIFYFSSVKQVHFSRSSSCWRPPCKRHQGSFQVWKLPFPLPSTCPGSDSFLQIWFVCLICHLALPFLFFWNKWNDVVTNLCMLCLLFLASDFSFIPQYICQFYVSTWLSHEVPSYLVKHYLRCFCGYFWVRLAFKSVEWLKLPHMWMDLIQSVGDLNRTRRLSLPPVRILVWLPFTQT